MPVRGIFGTLACIAIASMVCVRAEAQTLATCTVGFSTSASYGIAQGKQNAPFTATVKTANEQRLADGNFIHGTTLSHEARDSEGRTRSETAIGCERGKDGQLHIRLAVTVNDPVARTMMSWQVDDLTQKIVRVIHIQPVTPPIAPKQLTAEQRAEQLKRQKQIQSTQPQRQDTHTEQLGTRSFDGVAAEGTRTIRTIPAGEEGNDLPLAVVHESWISRDLGTTVMAIEDDPRRAKMTFELEDIRLGEPDASLFAPPEGYKVEEQLPVGPGPIQTR